MQYLELLSAPVCGEGDGVLSPAAAFAMQTADADHALELRVMHRDGRLRCYLGVADGTRELIRLKLLLNRFRFTYAPASLPPQNNAGALLLRKTEPLEVTTAVGAREWVLNAGALVPGELRLEVVYESLGIALEGCGYSLFFRRLDSLDETQLLQLRRCARDPEDTVSQLYRAAERIEFGGCIFGTPAQIEVLRGVFRENCPALELHDIEAAPVTAEAVMDRVRRLPPLRRLHWGTMLRWTLRKEEAEALSDLRQISRRFGIPRNPDTLFPPQQTAPPEGQDMLILGTGADGTPQRLPLRALRQHVFVSGAPGTGKGNFLFSIARQLHERKIPFLMIESAKEEQHHLQKKLPELKVWRPSGGSYILNPFSLPPDVPLSSYRQSLLQMMRTCFLLDGPMEGLFATTLSQCLAKYGCTESGAPEDTQAFGLSEFIREYNRLLTTNGYSERTRRDMRAAGITRLRPLLDQSPDVFDTAYSIPVSQLTMGENLLQLSALTTVESKQLFATILLISLGAWLRRNAEHQSGLRLVIIMDESHNLLRQAKNASGEQFSFAEEFQNLLLEMRSVGVGFIVADQSADNLPPTISDACATKVFLGPSPFSGIQRHAGLLKADQKVLDHLYLMKPGEGVWHTMGMSSGAFVRMDYVLDQYELEKPWTPKNTYLDSHPGLTCRTFPECRDCSAGTACTLRSREEARRSATKLMLDYRTRLNRHLRAIYEESEKGSEEGLRSAKRKYHACLKSLTAAAYRADGENSICTLTQFVRFFCREVEYDYDMSGHVQHALDGMQEKVREYLGRRMEQGDADPGA